MSSSSALPSAQSEWTVKLSAGIDALTLKTDAAVPQPKRGQVLVKVHATSLNYRDLLIAKGGYPLKMKDEGTIPTSDGAGEVVAIGEDVTELKVGDRVLATFTPKWQAGDNRFGQAYTGSFGGDVPGWLCQYRAVDSTALVKIPDSMSYEEASTLPCAGLTAWNALTDGRSPVRADHTVLVMGTGGVSIVAAQIARAHGARVIATSSSDEKLARLVSLGLIKKEDTINYKTTKEWGAKAKELAGGLGVDHVVEIGGQGTIAQAIEAVRPDGQITVIGLVTGANHTDVNSRIDPMRVLGGGFNVRGILVGSRAQLHDLVQMFALNPSFKPIVDKVFKLEEAKEAYKFLESGQHFGKVVIKTSQ